MSMVNKDFVALAPESNSGRKIYFMCVGVKVFSLSQLDFGVQTGDISQSLSFNQSKFLVFSLTLSLCFLSLSFHINLIFLSF